MMLLFFLFLLFDIVSCQNLILNGNFEDNRYYPWDHFSSELTIVTDDVYSGLQAIKVSRRAYATNGIRQVVKGLESGQHLVFNAYFKQLDGKHGNANYKLFETFKARFTYTYTTFDYLRSKVGYYDIALTPFVHFGEDWLQLQGDHVVPSKDFSLVYLEILGPEGDIDFLLDEVSLVPFVDDTDWKSEANARIQQIRKSIVHVEVQHPPSYNPDDIEIHVDHKRHLFGFGSSVNESHITDPSFKEYQDIFYRMFNWATLRGMDWSRVSDPNYPPTYVLDKVAMTDLESHGIKMRAEAFNSGDSPKWVQPMDGTALRRSISDRIQYISQLTKGKIAHWTVNKDLLHEQMFEEMTGDANFTEELFKMVHDADPSAKLFLDEYDVVASGAATSAYAELSSRYQSANVNIDGLGAQGNVGRYTLIDPIFMKKHLDELETTGLPVWISALEVINSDPSVRADMLETCLRTYFSHPNVEGVTLRGFWDQEININSSLVEDFTFLVNAAGQRYLDLVEKEWSTHVVYNLSVGPVFPMEAFHGDYDVTIYYKGKPLHKDSFQLGNSSLHYKATLDGTETEISLPSTIDPFSYVTHSMHLEKIHSYDLGKHISGKSDDFQCVTRVSSHTDTIIACEPDEVLTGCSSLVQSHGDLNIYRGEEIRFSKTDDKASCVAHTYGNLKGGVAVARCCKKSTLMCSYIHGSTIRAQVDHEPLLPCDPGYSVTGCSTYYVGEVFGAFPSEHQDGCVGVHRDRNTDTNIYAICCRERQLTCKTMTSQPSDAVIGANSTVSCDQGYTIMSCSARSYEGGVFGAIIEGTTPADETCVAVNGNGKIAGDTGVMAVAVCCVADGGRFSIIG